MKCVQIFCNASGALLNLDKCFLLAREGITIDLLNSREEVLYLGYVLNIDGLKDQLKRIYPKVKARLIHANRFGYPPGSRTSVFTGPRKYTTAPK